PPVSSLFPYTTLFRSWVPTSGRYFFGHRQHQLALFRKNIHFPALTELAEQNLFGQRFLDFILHQTSHGTSAHFFVIAMLGQPAADRKSTRLNSSHVKI